VIDEAPVASSGSEPAFEVIEPGLLTTVQDGGRPAYGASGVPPAGAADPVGLAVANLLAGNATGAAAIECTLLGPRLRVLRDVVVGLAGADLGAAVGTVRLEPRSSHRLHAGDLLSFESTAAEPSGCRAYLAVAGGVDVPVVLGSRSTSLVGAFGGFDGRSFRAGDVIRAASAVPAGNPPDRRLPAGISLPAPTRRIRLLPGPDAAGGAGAAAWISLASSAWRVEGDSDRRGLRLSPADGSAPPLPPGGFGERQSHGVVPGAIQLTPSGQPVVLMPDSGTTGGYPVIAIVCSADRALLGQLAPWSEVRFRGIDVATAVRAEAELRSLMTEIRQALGEGLSS